jgi:hypothetical protein
MRRRAMRGVLTAVLLAAVVATARAAAEDDDAPAPPLKPAPSGWSAMWSGLFGSPPKPSEKVEKKAERPAKPPTAAERDALLRRENDDYYRRIKVCLRLEEMAQQQNDEAFFERIEALQEEIINLHLQKMASLGQAQVNDDEAAAERPKFGSHNNRRDRHMEDDQ